jgi:hypothetical protein
VAEELTFKEKLHSLQFARPPRSDRVIKASQVRPMAEPSWERGIAGERRPDGSFMPYLSGDGSPMGVHEAQSRHGDIEEMRRRRAQATTT